MAERLKWYKGTKAELGKVLKELQEDLERELQGLNKQTQKLCKDAVHPQPPKQRKEVPPFRKGVIIPVRRPQPHMIKQRSQGMPQKIQDRPKDRPKDRPQSVGVFTRLAEQFPEAHLSSHTRHKMKLDYHGHVKRLLKEVTTVNSAKGAGGEDKRVWRVLTDVRQRQTWWEENQMREQRSQAHLEAQRLAKLTSRSLRAWERDRRMVAARVRRIFDNCYLVHRQQVDMDLKTREEMIVKHVFDEMLTVHAAQLREEKHLSEGERQENLKRLAVQLEEDQNTWSTGMRKLLRRAEVKARLAAEVGRAARLEINNNIRQLRLLLQEETNQLLEALRHQHREQFCFREADAERVRRSRHAH